MTFETLVSALATVVERTPTRPAVRSATTAWTYAELWSRSAAVARGLLGPLRAAPGDRIGILGQNDPWYLAAYIGILRAGCVAVPLNQLLRPDELAAQLVLVGATRCLVGSIDDLAAEGVAAAVPTSSIEETAAIGPTSLLLPPVVPGDDATILLTSGSTGMPKGAVQTHATMRFAVAEMHSVLPFSDEDVMLAFLPFFASIPEQILPTLLAGGTLEVLPRFDLAAVDEALARATAFDAVPTLMARMLDGLDPKRLAHLRWVMFASEPMPPALLHRWWETLPDVHTFEFYGMTEMLTITAAPPEVLRASPHSVGRAFPGSRVAVVDADGRPLPPDVDGEVVCASPARMRGYLPEGIDPATWRLPDGAMRTGDLGRLDAAGHLTLTGRIKDIIISGGMNIAPSEIETAAVAHPDVISAVVVGVPDERWGETPIVVAIPRRGSDLTAAALLAHCRDRLASYKRPSGAALVEHFPVTGIGKPSKAAIRDAILSGGLPVTRVARRADAAGVRG
jgi:acyl-CoA synthetase (AMP-forming)/AMP-acid ligase II